MKNSDIKGEIKVTCDNRKNIRLSWLMDDGLHDNIPFQVVMSPVEAQKMCDDIGDILYGELDTFGL